MAKTVTNKLNTEYVALSLMKRYPELVELTEDWNGFYKSVQIRLHQFGLAKDYSPEDIIVEVISRWHRKTVEKKEQVPCIAGWMRVTALNCIRELKRQGGRTDVYDPVVLEGQIIDSENHIKREDEEDSDTRQYVRAAMTKLSKDKQQLLTLRIVNELSWDEIAVHYATQGKIISAATLRQRGSRALKELRQIVLEMIRQ